MPLKDVMRELEGLGHAKVREQNAKAGAGEAQFGVKLGDVRAVAKRVGRDHGLALELWATGNAEAQFVAALVMDPKALTGRELEGLLRSVAFSRVADWLNGYVVSKHPEKEALREKWVAAKNPWLARAGWHLTAERVAKGREGLDLAALLDRIEAELGGAKPEVQWTMNNALAAIGIHEPKLRKRAVAIGEKLGVYRDYPVPKGCTSPFAPLWIEAMAERQG